MKDRSDDPSHHERTLLPRSYIPFLHYQICKYHTVNKKQLEWTRNNRTPNEIQSEWTRNNRTPNKKQSEWTRNNRTPNKKQSDTEQETIAHRTRNNRNGRTKRRVLRTTHAVIIQLLVGVHVHRGHVHDVAQFHEGLVDEDQRDEGGEALLGEACDETHQRTQVERDDQHQEGGRPHPNPQPQLQVLPVLVATETETKQTFICRSMSRYTFLELAISAL